MITLLDDQHDLVDVVDNKSQNGELNTLSLRMIVLSKQEQQSLKEDMKIAESKIQELLKKDLKINTIIDNIKE